MPEASGWREEAAAFAADGLVFPVRDLFPRERLDAVDALLTTLVDSRPAGLASEDLLNLHLTLPAVMNLCREPRVLSLASALLGTCDVSVFTSRILCKQPGGKPIEWHQDSLYWPLESPSRSDGDGEPRTTTGPVIASLWLTLDDLTPDMGVMSVLPFSAQPSTRGRSAHELVTDAGGSTSAFDNFNLTINDARLNVEGARRVIMARGEAEWHSAFVVHRSDTNASSRRRLAWIVRYCATGTRVVGGVRDSFPADYPLIPVAGDGAPAGDPHEDDLSVEAPIPAACYAPCFGTATAALKK